MATAYGATGKIREREGAGSFVAVPHGHFRTKDDKWIAIACTTDKMFERLAEAMEQPHLAASVMYGEQRKRLAARDPVNQLVVEWVASLTREEVMARCLAREVPVGQVNSISDIFEDPQFIARENLIHARDEGIEEGIDDIIVPGVVPRLSRTPGRLTNLGPTLGNATDDVMGNLLGLAAAEIARLREQRII
jgi:succinyl-CoA:(S)-malate CoA-transferase subunit A